MRRFTTFRVLFGLIIVAILSTVTPAVALAQSICAPLPPPAGVVIDVTPAQAGNLPSIVQSARPGDTVQLADGTYRLPQTLVFQVPGVTVRSKSGNRGAVILDGEYGIGDVLLIMESDITIADLTVMRSYYHPVHVVPATHTTSGTLLHNLRLADGAQQFVKINPNNGYYADEGVVRCSSLEMTDAGRTQVRDNCYTGGIDGHQANGWQIYGNVFNGFWCSAGLSEHAIHFWMSSRDTFADRNVIMNSARGVGLGLGERWPVTRFYADQPCGGKAGLGHYGGSITNTFVFANDPRLFASQYGFDAGITLEQSCGTSILHNTVFSTVAPFSSIEWRFADTMATIANNIVSHNLRPRDGAVATLAGNITSAPASLFVDAVTTGDLHLRSTATAAIDQAAPLAAPVGWDIDSAPRGVRADIGADEFAGPAFTLTTGPAALAGAPITVQWSAPAGQGTSADWIGLFASGTGDSAVLEQSSTGGQSTGTATFTAPGVAGTYEFRYFRGSLSVRVAVSNPVTVSVPPPGPGPGPAPGPVQSLFDGQTPPATYASSNDYELGVRLFADVAGRITALKFWKVPGETGTHIGRVWSPAGDLLASVTFTNETASGWQQQALPTPLAIAPYTQYSVTVNSTNNLYAAAVSALTTELIRDNLHAPSGSNGLYGFTLGSMPTTTYANTHYFRDVVFALGP